MATSKNLDTLPPLTANRPAITSIPSGWPQAATFLSDLRDHMPLTVAEWNVILDWLMLTAFDSRSYLAGEVAAGLIRDLAPESVKQLALAPEPTREWQKQFQAIVASGIDRTAELREHATESDAAGYTADSRRI